MHRRDLLKAAVAIPFLPMDFLNKKKPQLIIPNSNLKEKPQLIIPNSNLDEFGKFCETLQIMTPFRREYSRMADAQGNEYLPYNLEPCHRKIIEAYENDHFVIYKKYRQGGFSTLNVAYALWKVKTVENLKVMFIAKTDRGAIELKRILQIFMKTIPLCVSQFNDHYLALANGSSIQFSNPQYGRKTVNYLFIEEAAFMDKHWTAIFPTVGWEGKCFVSSTPNGKGNWFHHVYDWAEKGKNSFKLIPTHYLENSICDRNMNFWNTNWDKIRESLGEKAWRQEVLCEFI